MTRVVTVSAGLSQPSSTRLLADRLTAAVGAELGGNGAVETVELREYAHDITDNLLTGFPPERLRALLERVGAADGLILVTPTFTASYSGLFKSFVDVLDRDSLRGRPVLLGATGGTERHSLMLDHAMRPLFAYLGAVTVPTAVYAASTDWGNDAALHARIARAARELADALTRPSSTPSAPATEHFVGHSVEVTPFEQLLHDVRTGGPAR